MEVGGRHLNKAANHTDKMTSINSSSNELVGSLSNCSKHLQVMDVIYDMKFSRRNSSIGWSQGTDNHGSPSYDKFFLPALSSTGKSPQKNVSNKYIEQSLYNKQKRFSIDLMMSSHHGNTGDFSLSYHKGFNGDDNGGGEGPPALGGEERASSLCRGVGLGESSEHSIKLDYSARSFHKKKRQRLCSLGAVGESFFDDHAKPEAAPPLQATKTIFSFGSSHHSSHRRHSIEIGCISSTHITNFLTNNKSTSNVNIGNPNLKTASYQLIDNNDDDEYDDNDEFACDENDDNANSVSASSTSTQPTTNTGTATLPSIPSAKSSNDCANIIEEPTWVSQHSAESNSIENGAMQQHQQHQQHKQFQHNCMPLCSIDYNTKFHQNQSYEAKYQPSCFVSGAADRNQKAVSFSSTSIKRQPSSLLQQPTSQNPKQKVVMEAFHGAMGMSLKSQQAIHEWDKKMGLKRSHSKTMRQSMRSRKKIRDMVHKLISSSSS